MKKGLFLSLLAVLLIIPFINVKATANVEITKIELLEASEGVVVNEEPTASGLNINFNLAFGNVEDVAKYKVTIKNNDEQSYTIATGEAQVSDYMNYNFAFVDDDNVIAGNGEKELLVTITYENEVPVAALSGGKYNESNEIEITLSNSETAEAVPAVENPKTGDKVLLYVDTLIVSILLCGVAIKTKKVRKGVALFALLLVALPIGVKALEELTIKINTEVEISKDRQFCFKYVYSDEDSRTDFDFTIGETWDEYLADGTHENFRIVEDDVDVYNYSYSSQALNNTSGSSRLSEKMEIQSDGDANLIYFVPVEYTNCIAEADKDINAIINGRNISELSEEELNQLMEISTSEEYNAKFQECDAMINYRSNVKKNEKIKTSDKGCYVYSFIDYDEGK